MKKGRCVCGSRTFCEEEVAERVALWERRGLRNERQLEVDLAASRKRQPDKRSNNNTGKRREEIVHFNRFSRTGSALHQFRPSSSCPLPQTRKILPKTDQISLCLCLCVYCIRRNSLTKTRGSNGVSSRNTKAPMSFPTCRFRSSYGREKLSLFVCVCVSRVLLPVADLMGRKATAVPHGT